MDLVKRSHSGEEPAPCGSGEELTPCGSGEEPTPRGSGEEEPFRQRAGPLWVW